MRIIVEPMYRNLESLGFEWVILVKSQAKTEGRGRGLADGTMLFLRMLDDGRRTVDEGGRAELSPFFAGQCVPFF